MKKYIIFLAFSTATLFATAQPADTIQFSWQVNAPNETKRIDFVVDNDSQFFAINWGDGNIDTLLNKNDWIYHTYVFARNYTVTISCDTNHEDVIFYCFGQNVTALDIDRFSKMRFFGCWDNHLQLSDLYKVVEMAVPFYSRQFGEQRLLPQTILVDDSVDYSSQKEFGDTATVFEIEKNGFPAVLNTDYTIYDGIIVFKTAGKYFVTMTNAAITSSLAPPIVIAEINVVYPNADATLSFLGVSHGELMPNFDSAIVNYTACIGNDIHEVLITATPTDSNATVSGNIGWQMITKDTTVLTVIVTAQDGTTTKKYFVTITHCNVGIAEATQKTFNVFPNPTNGEITIEIAGQPRNDETLEIFDILGNCLHSSKLSPEKNTITINISHYPNGMYFIKLNNNITKITKI